MLKEVKIEHFENLWKQRNGFLVISIGLLIANILLASILTLRSEKTIIVPAGFKQTFWAKGELMSDSYLIEMTDYFATKLLNSTPESHASKRDIVLQYVSPRYYDKLRSQLIEEEEKMRKENLTTLFVPREITVKLNELATRVTGTLTSYVSGDRVGQLKKTYQANYSYVGGILMMDNFYEVKGDE